MESHLALVFLLMVLLLAASAFFSGSETALMSVSRLRLRYLARNEPRRVARVEHLLQHPENLIGTILVGNNLVNVALSSVATVLAVAAWGETGIAYVTGLLTLTILVFAETTPKVYAKYFNEPVSLAIAPSMKFAMILLKPLVFIVSIASNGLLRIMGVNINRVGRQVLSEDEVKTCIQIGAEDGSITQEETGLLSRVFSLNDLTIGSIMVPLDKIAFVDDSATLAQLTATVARTGHSRFPVVRAGSRDIIGVIHAKDLLRYVSTPEKFGMKHVLQQAYFVAVDKKIDAQLRAFKARHLQMAIVLDAEGGVVGLVTLENVLEELVGSIQDEYDVE
ncbi:MAG: HlyC/CorC family transporter [Dehalococcoidia bacterium]|nr:HlyC/CorC family transporter [Dehalococcoidia bacterium]